MGLRAAQGSEAAAAFALNPSPQRFPDQLCALADATQTLGLAEQVVIEVTVVRMAGGACGDPGINPGII